MPADRISEQSLGELQIDAAYKAKVFMRSAEASTNPRVAADWTLAAKNAMSVALSVEQLVKTRRADR